MASYSQEFKDQIVRKLMSPTVMSVAALSRETGIPSPTLYAWKKHYRSEGFVVPSKSSPSDQWDAKTKLAAVIDTAALNQAERSEYCRQHGLYPEQLDAWKAMFESLDAVPVSSRELSQAKKKTKQLEKELRRKEKALAETAALLTLSKKASAIWGINEDD